MSKLAILFAAISLISAAPLLTALQASQGKQMNLVTWYGPGSIPLPNSPDWTPDLLTVYDHIQRPVAQFTNPKSHVIVSYILFENHSGKPTSEGCRADAIDPIVQNEGANLSKRMDGNATTVSGQSLATTSYFIDMGAAKIPHKRNLFGFLGNEKTCAEIHVSSFGDDPAVQDAMKATLSEFNANLDYQPNAQYYFLMASLLFKKEPGLAAPYYKSTLDAMPSGDAKYLTSRRVTTDQLVMALGISGDLKDSRAVAEKAIEADPDYPINYYNLACADAEKHDAVNAKVHLQQAFDRHANALKGEQMPDPTTDSSILKLKKDKVFWAFVESLPKN